MLSVATDTFLSSSSSLLMLLMLMSQLSNLVHVPAFFSLRQPFCQRTTWWRSWNANCPAKRLTQQKCGSCSSKTMLQFWTRLFWITPAWYVESQNYNKMLAICVDFVNTHLFIPFQNPNTSSPAMPNVLDAIGDVKLNNFMNAQLNNASFVDKLFQKMLRPFLASPSRNFLSCLSSKNFSCQTYQIVYVKPWYPMPLSIQLVICLQLNKKSR